MRLFCGVHTALSGVYLTQVRIDPRTVRDRLDFSILADTSSTPYVRQSLRTARNLLAISLHKDVGAIHGHIELSVSYAAHKRLPLGGSEH
jgi:hypothetical protein